MRKAILGAASALTLASPAMAADLAVPRYSEVPEYAYRTAPPVIVEEPPPVMVAPPPVVVEDYPIYAPPPVYVVPPSYAYAGPVWREGPYRHHYRARW
jgi:opacity protein-like surface antigen